jgi:hypothetical protein
MKFSERILLDVAMINDYIPFKITNKHIELLEEFCAECDRLGFVNNSSIDRMKFDEVNEFGGYFGMMYNGKLVSVAGYSHFPEMGDDAWRIFYRSASFPGHSPSKGLNRGIGKRAKLYIDEFIKVLPNQKLYITTNLDNGGYKHIVRYHKAMKISHKLKSSFIIHECDMQLFGVMQSIWRFSVDEYLLQRTKEHNL